MNPIGNWSEAIAAVHKFTLEQRFLSRRDHYTLLNSIFCPEPPATVPDAWPECGNGKRKDFINFLCNDLVGKFLWCTGASDVFRNWLLGDRAHPIEGHESLW